MKGNYNIAYGTIIEILKRRKKIANQCKCQLGPWSIRISSIDTLSYWTYKIYIYVYRSETT